MSFKIKFWGVRGSIACPSPNHIAFGGNTSCVEVSAGGERIILDAGTGVRNLGHWMLKKNVRFARFLMSHTHWDHINGFPFFSPGFRKDHRFVIMAGHLSDSGGIDKVLAGQMAQPTFPVPIEMMGAKLEYEDFRGGDTFTLSREIKVRTAPLNHPNGATGYRIEYRGKSMVYVTDTEHVIGRPDENILDLIAGADLVIYDSTYTDEEFPSKIGWGHSTWQEAVRLCRAVDVKTLAIFHHDPDHEDLFMERIEREARSTWIGAFVAREHMRFNLT
ncbi:MAG: MBL fold metallo-hydrolase [Alphaproteobacteria bacterium]|nr:MBL fold metallo-hydrolase [Alphaproteobacteria bacterium]